MLMSFSGARRRGFRFSASLLAVAALVACSEGTAPISENDEFLNAIGNPDVPLLGAASSDRAPCEFDATGGVFNCPTRTVNGLTMTRSFAFYDANGASMASMVRGTTAATESWFTVSGTATMRDGGSMTVNRAGRMRTDGLLDPTGPRRLNGVEGGTTEATMTGRDGQQFTSRHRVADTTRDVLLPPPGSDQRWPIGGTRIHVVTRTGPMMNGGAPIEITTRIVETFSPNGIVTIEMTGPAGTRTCTRDLTQARSRPTCS